MADSGMTQYAVKMPDGTTQTVQMPSGMDRTSVEAALKQFAGGQQSLSMPRHAPMLAEKPGVIQRIQPRIDQAAAGVAQGVGDITDLLQPGFAPALNNVDTFNRLMGINAPPATWRPGSEVAQTVYGAPVSDATDPAGRYIQRGFRGATGATLFPGGAGSATAAAVGAGSGLAGQGAVDVTGTQGTPAENWARLGGEVAGGALTGVGAGIFRRTPAQLFHEAIGDGQMPTPYEAMYGVRPAGVTADQLAAAQKLMDDAATRGTPITAAEAIAQITGRNTDLTAMQRVAEQSHTGSRVFDSMMSERPAANAGAFNQAVSDVVPNPSTSPETIAPRMAEAAGSVVDDAARARSAAVSKYYQSASPTPVAPTFGSGTPAPIQSILDDIDNALNKDMGGVGVDSAAGKKLLQFKDELLASADSNGNFNVGTLNNLYKTWRDNITSSPMDNPNATGKTIGGIIGRINNKLGAILEGQSPELAAGNQIYKNLTETIVDPLKQGPTGRLAEATTFDQVANTLMPANPKDLTADSIRTSINQIKMKNPDLLPEFLRQNLQAVWNQATKDLQAGPNQWGGAGFAKAISANPEQEKILRTLIESLPAGQTKWAGFRNFLDVLEAQGKRQQPGSMTEFNRMMTQDLSASNLSALPRPLGWLNQMVERWRYGQNAGEIARVLTDPKGVELLSRMALTRPQSARAATLAAEIMALTRANPLPTQPAQ